MNKLTFSLFCCLVFKIIEEIQNEIPPWDSNTLTRFFGKTLQGT